MLGDARLAVEFADEMLSKLIYDLCMSTVFLLPYESLSYSRCPHGMNIKFF